MQNKDLNVDKDLYLAYFRKSADYYYQKLLKSQNSFAITFNIWSFLFPPAWLIYRKLHIEFILCLITIVALNYFFKGWTLPLSLFLLRLVLGFIADRLYLCKATRMIDKAKHICQTKTEKNYFLEQEGGVSKENAELFILVYILLTIIISAIKIFILQ